MAEGPLTPIGNLRGRTDETGSLYVKVTTSAGATQYAQGTAATDTDELMMAGAVRRDTPAVASGVADGDRAAVSVDASGQVWARARQQVDADTGAGAAPTDLVALALPASGGPVAAIGGSGVVNDQTQRVVLATDQPAIPTVTSLTGGGIAHDSADSGNPHKIGAKAYSPDGTTPGTAVAEADRTDLKADLDGRLLVSCDHPRSLHKHLDGTAAYTDEGIAADPGDGFQVIITNIIASNGEAIALNFFLEEGATKIFGPIYLPAVAGSGFCSGPIRLPVTASTAVTLTSSAANDQSFDIDYYIQAV